MMAARLRPGAPKEKEMIKPKMELSQLMTSQGYNLSTKLCKINGPTERTGIDMPIGDITLESEERR